MGPSARSWSEPLMALGGGIGKRSSGDGGLSAARGSLQYQTPASLVTPHNGSPIWALPKRTPACRIDPDLGDAACQANTVHVQPIRARGPSVPRCQVLQVNLEAVTFA